METLNELVNVEMDEQERANMIDDIFKLYNSITWEYLKQKGTN